MIKIAINGFGRIGRLAARIILNKFTDKLELVAINTSGSMDTAGWAHLLKHDSVYGNYATTIKIDGNNLLVDKQKIKITGEKDPSLIPWKEAGPEIVLECSGVFRKEQDVKKMLTGSINKE